MNVLVFSDIQYRNYLRVESTQVNWLDIQLKATDEVFEVAKANNIRHIIFNGDLFEEKNKINVPLYNKVWNYYRKKAEQGFELFFNLGNHDMASISGETSLQPFSEFASVIKVPTNIFVGGIEAFIVPYNYMKDAGVEDPTSSSINEVVLFLHEEIEGLNFGPMNYTGNPNIKLKDLKSYRLVVNGHIHKPQEVDNVVNVGALVQQDFGEAGEDKRIIIINNDMTVKSIPINGPKFYPGLELNKKNIEKVREYSTGINFFRFDISEEEVDNSIFDLPNVFYKIVKRKEREFRLKTGLSTNDEIKQYVEEFNKDLDMDRLIKIGKGIIKDARS